MRYLCGRVDVVVNSVPSCAVHEMLCSVFIDQFDNRMLQEKKQLRGNACGLVHSFPLLYSKNIKEEICGQTNAGSPTAGYRDSAATVTTIDSNFSTLSRR